MAGILSYLTSTKESTSDASSTGNSRRTSWSVHNVGYGFTPTTSYGIHRSAQKTNSANLACIGFSEVGPPVALVVAASVPSDINPNVASPQ